MIDMLSIRKSYRPQNVETEALSNSPVKSDAGAFGSVLGPAGSGSPTRVKVAGLGDTFEQGSYVFDGEDVSKLTDREMSRIRNRRIGFIFQSFNLIPDLNAFDNIDVPLRYRGMGAADRRKAIDQALDVVGMSARAKHYPAQLSGGQQQRVAVARALVGSPSLILADEPTGNLDTAMANEILDLLEQINEMDTTVVMVTHEPDLAARARRRLHLLDGRLIDIEMDDRPTPLVAAAGTTAPVRM